MTVLEEAGEGNALLIDDLLQGLQAASAASSGLMTLLRGCDPGLALTAAQLLALLAPLDDRLDQALHAAHLLVSPDS